MCQCMATYPAALKWTYHNTMWSTRERKGVKLIVNFPLKPSQRSLNNWPGTCILMSYHNTRSVVTIQ